MSFHILHIMERFNSVLQSPNVTVAGMLEGAETIKKMLEEIQTEKKFNEIFVDTNTRAGELGLEPLTLPRARKVPKRFQSDLYVAPKAVSVEEHYRKEYYKVIESAKVNLKEYFSSTDIDLYCKLTDSLLTDKVDVETLSKYPELSDHQNLKLQLSFFKSQFNPKNIYDCKKIFQNMKTEVREMFPMVENLLKLILISPASSCSAERSFSALRRLKGYLRSTMTQKN